LRTLHDADGDARVRIPRFSKALDDRLPERDWRTWRGRPDYVVLEGWCVGARPSAESAWRGPINAREAREDPDGRWWRWSNAALGQHYPACWDMLDRLCGIVIADFDDVIEGRYRQEQDNVLGQPEARAMSRAEVVEFVSLFERLTRALQRQLLRRADYVVRRDADFHFTLD
jgi:D-glycerate 3-kinase